MLEVCEYMGRMNVRLNGEPLQEVDFKYLGSQVTADGDAKGMWYNEFLKGISRWQKCAEQLR